MLEGNYVPNLRIPSIRKLFGACGCNESHTVGSMNRESGRESGRVSECVAAQNSRIRTIRTPILDVLPPSPPLLLHRDISRKTFG